MSNEQLPVVDGNEKGILALGTLGGLLGILIPLIVWAVKKETLSPYAKCILTGMVNFELTLLIVSILVSLIPVVGVIIGLILSVFNLVVVIMAFSASSKKNEFKYPMTYNFIK